MKVYSPGAVPEEVLQGLTQSEQEQVERCFAVAADDGTCFYSVDGDCIIISLIVGRATKAFLHFRKMLRQGKTVFFLGHTPHVTDWGLKHCEVVGVLFKYKEMSWVT